MRNWSKTRPGRLDRTKVGLMRSEQISWPERVKLDNITMRGRKEASLRSHPEAVNEQVGERETERVRRGAIAAAGRPSCTIPLHYWILDLLFRHTLSAVPATVSSTGCVSSSTRRWLSAIDFVSPLTGVQRVPIMVITTMRCPLLAALPIHRPIARCAYV